MPACDNALVSAAYAAHNVGCGYADQLVQLVQVAPNARIKFTRLIIINLEFAVLEVFMKVTFQ